MFRIVRQRAKGRTTAIASLIDIKKDLRKLNKAARQSLQLDAVSLAIAYDEQRRCAPSRNQGYFSRRRDGATGGAAARKHREEHLAAALFSRGSLSLPDGERLKLLDYQFPLKSVRADDGIGKIDLFGVREDGTPVVIELKIDGNREDHRIALIEALIYAAILEANIRSVSEEAAAAKGCRLVATRPHIFLVGTSGYWEDIKAYPPLAALQVLARETGRVIATPIELMRLDDAGLVGRTSARRSVMHGHAFLSAVDGHDPPSVPFRPTNATGYRAALHRGFWAYRRRAFSGDVGLFEPMAGEGNSAPVFQNGVADRNILVPPDANSDLRALITGMIVPRNRHRWFASMASSQALAQSVFAGLAACRRLDALEAIRAEDDRPAFFESCVGFRLTLEHRVSTLGEPRPTSLDALLDGPQKVAVEVKFVETEFGGCSRPGLRPHDAAFARDHCTGDYAVQRGRKTRCSLSEQGISYWQFAPQLFFWDALQDHSPCPLAFTYQLVRNVMAVCVDERGNVDPYSGHVLVIYDARNPAFAPRGRADAQWWTCVRALRFPHLLRRLSWQCLTRHLRQLGNLDWLADGLSDKYGFE